MGDNRDAIWGPCPRAKLTLHSGTQYWDKLGRTLGTRPIALALALALQTFPAPFHGRTYATHVQTDKQRVCMHCLVDVQTTYATHIQTDMQRVCMHSLVDVQTFSAPCDGRTHVKLATHTYRLTCNKCA